MAGIKVTGLDELRAKATELSRVAAGEAMEAAQAAAAKIFSQAAKNAAPVGRDPSNKSKKRPPHGELKSSTRTFKGKPTALMSGGRTSKIARTLVGPSKQHGFYGYFLSEGWKTPLGSAMVYWAKPGRWRPESWQIKTRRRLRSEATKSTHTQIGLSRWKQINAPYPNWFKNAMEGAMATAMEKAAAAFESVMKRVA